MISWSMEFFVNVVMGVVATGIVSLGAYRDRGKQQRAIRSIQNLAREVANQIQSSPTMLVIGFQHHGKSSFINTVFRVIRDETGPLIRRAETGPNPERQTTVRYKAYYMLDDEETLMFTLLDSPPIQAGDDMDLVELKAMVLNSSEKISKTSSVPAAYPMTVLFVVSAVELTAKPELFGALETVTTSIREEGMRFVMIITFKLGVNLETLNRLKRELSTRCANESVYCIENYVEDSFLNPKAVLEWSYQTCITIVEILKQGLEFCK